MLQGFNQRFGDYCSDPCRLSPTDAFNHRGTTADHVRWGQAFKKWPYGDHRALQRLTKDNGSMGCTWLQRKHLHECMWLCKGYQSTHKVAVVQRKGTLESLDDCTNQLKL